MARCGAPVRRHTHSTPATERHTLQTTRNHQEFEELTSRNLPLAPLADPEPRGWRAQLNSHTTIEDEKHHLHLAAIFASLGASRGYIDDPGAEEREREGLGETEFGAVDVAHFDGGGSVSNFYFGVRGM